jgi:hypothetical protein
MTPRAIMLGLLLGLFVAGTAYLNDQVIRQTMLIGSHLPVVVFGAIALLMLVVQPLMRSLRSDGGFRVGEMAVASAIALAACGWPGNGFYRSFTAVVAMPAQQIKTQPHWVAADVLSFVPGGSGQLAPEHVIEPGNVARLLRDSAATPSTPAGRIHARLGIEDRRLLAELAETEVPTYETRRQLSDAINRVLADPTLYDAEAFAQVAIHGSLESELLRGAGGEMDAYDVVRANRALLVLTFPQHVMAAPTGRGVLFANGRGDTPTHQRLISGERGDKRLTLLQLPWGEWWPTLRLWGGLAVCLGLAGLCLAMIVHPQWSRRELLPYPIARVVHEISRIEPGRRLPAVATHRGFWIALGVVGAVHAVNGLHSYFEALPAIPLRLSFTPLRDLFPNASRVFGSAAYFEPQIYPAVIGFAFFLSTAVSLSLGVAHLLFIMLGAVMIANAVPFERDYLGGSKVNMMGFGSFVAMAGIILFIGRRYYVNVLGTMIGMPRTTETPAYARWAGWGVVLFTFAAVALLYQGGLSLPLGAAMVGLILLMWLVISRISAETGMFLIKPAWLPVGIITAMAGFEAMGPTAYIVMALATIILAGDAREVVMGFLTNGLKLADHTGRRNVERIAPWLALMVIVSLLVAGGVTLLVQQNLGLNHSDTVGTRTQTIRPFNEFANHINKARAHQTMDDAVVATSMQRLTMIKPEPGAWMWLGVGFGLVMMVAAARLRWHWFPLHPVIFLVWGTWPMFVFSASLLLGWLIKALVMNLGGARAYQSLLPVAVGVIFADVLSALGWSLIGVVYYLTRGVTPPVYLIFPG